MDSPGVPCCEPLPLHWLYIRAKYEAAGTDRPKTGQVSFILLRHMSD